MVMRLLLPSGCRRTAWLISIVVVTACSRVCPAMENELVCTVCIVW